MKKRIRQSNSAKDKPKPTPGIPPTVEEIRQRAYEIFLELGGTHGRELDDWLRAEEELKREHAQANPQAQADNPRESR